MKRKIRVAVLFGGRSAEYEVSIQSAENIVKAIDPKKYDTVLINIDRDGRWRYIDSYDDSLKKAVSTKSDIELLIDPFTDKKEFVRLKKNGSIGKIDIIFPVLHGTFGEDGTVQGLLKLADIPFVGAGVLGSAVAMDKDFMKRLLRDASVPIPRFLIFDWTSKKSIDFDEVKKELDLPLFIKPSNLGSSVGISKVKDREEFGSAVYEAFAYDNKIIIEECIRGREIECSVLGNENPIASVPGEVIPKHEFYSYEAKYIDDNGALLEIPAMIQERQTLRVKELAIKSFKVLGCEGMARVDFFLKDSGEVIVNEVNTIPGFTNISMYPKLWEASGIPQRELIDRLIELAFERYERESKLKRSFLS